KINGVATERGKQDYDELLRRWQKETPKAKEVQDWQKSYVEELVKRGTYEFDSQAVREYFPYDRVKEGVLATTSKMFGVTYKRVDLPVWHPSVEAYEMRDADG